MLPVPLRAPLPPEQPRPESTSWSAAAIRFWVVLVVVAPCVAVLIADVTSAGGVVTAIGVAVAIVVRFRKFFSPRRLPARWRGWLAAFLALALLGYGARLYHLEHADGISDVAGARSVDVEIYRTREVTARSYATSSDPEVIADLAALFAKAERTQAHKCGPQGFIVFQHGITPRGLFKEIKLLAGHDPEWYELVSSGRYYRVPRAEFVAAMKRIGVEVPLTCP